MTCWAGIDPGVNGSIAFYRDGAFSVFDLPVCKPDRHTEIDTGAFDDLLQEYNPHLAVIEDTFGVAGCGAKSSYNFGIINGGILCALRMFHFNVKKVLPKVWQASRLPGIDDTKTESINAARALTDSKALLRPGARKPSHDRADALNICAYALAKFPL